MKSRSAIGQTTHQSKYYNSCRRDNGARALLTQVDDTNKPGSVYGNVLYVFYTVLTCQMKSDIVIGARTSFSSSR